jgi:hypothetical protein
LGNEKTKLLQSILSSFHFIKSGKGWAGRLIYGQADVKFVVLYEVILLDSDREASTIYCFVQSPDDRGLEILIIRGDIFKSFVRYVPEIRDSEMIGIAHKLIDIPSLYD